MQFVIFAELILCNSTTTCAISKLESLLIFDHFHTWSEKIGISLLEIIWEDYICIMTSKKN